MARLIKVSETVAARRQVEFQLVAADGITPANGEDGGQPQISVNGAAWTSSGIGLLAQIGSGAYNAALTAAAVATVGDRIRTRYSSGGTAECPGDTAEVVAYDPDQAIADILSKTNTIGSGGRVTVITPVATDGTVTVFQGDSYTATSGFPLDFTVPAGRADLTGASILFEGGTLSVAGSVLSSSASAAQRIRVELTSAQTDSQDIRQYPYTIRATLSDGEETTLFNGIFTVANPYG